MRLTISRFVIRNVKTLHWLVGWNFHVDFPTWGMTYLLLKRRALSQTMLVQTMVQTTRSAPESDLSFGELDVFLTSSGGCSQDSCMHAGNCRRSETRLFIPRFSNIHPFIMHTFTHRRRCQPRRATASWSGAVRVRCLAQGHLDTQLG